MYETVAEEYIEELNSTLTQSQLVSLLILLSVEGGREALAKSAEKRLKSIDDFLSKLLILGSQINFEKII